MFFILLAEKLDVFGPAGLELIQNLNMFVQNLNVFIVQAQKWFKMLISVSEILMFLSCWLKNLMLFGPACLGIMQNLSV